MPKIDGSFFFSFFVFAFSIWPLITDEQQNILILGIKDRPMRVPVLDSKTIIVYTIVDIIIRKSILKGVERIIGCRKAVLCESRV